jgi:ABC-2 type transport system permease protein
MPRIAAIANKELRQFLRDRLTLSLTVFLPLVQLTLFATALTLNVRHLPLAIEDLDRTPASRRLMDAFLATGKFTLTPLPAGMRPERALDAGLVRALLHIPPDFSRNLRTGREAPVQLLLDGSDSNTAVVVRNSSAAIAQTFRSDPGQPPFRPLIDLRTTHWFNPGLSDRWFFGSGALGMVLILFPALLGALAAAREHEDATIVQAYASTLSAPEFVLGKAIPYVLIGFGQTIICFAFGFAFFDYRVPPYPLVMLIALLFYLCAAVFYGMAVGNLLRAQAAAIQAVQLGAFLLSLLMSGFLMPIQNMPDLLQWLSLLLPARHFIEVTRNTMLRGGGWETSAIPITALFGLTLIFFLANVRRLRRMQFSG